MLYVILSLVVMLSLGCSSKREHYIAPKSTRCSANAIDNEYIFVFEDGAFELVKGTQSAHSRLTQENNPVKWYEPNYRVYLEANDLEAHNPANPAMSSLNEWRQLGVGEYWDQGYFGQGIIVAVVDSGVDTRSPFLSSNWSYNVGELGGDGYLDNIDNDGNGFVDDFNGWNFLDNSNFQNDEVNHGTQIAHLIAGSSQTPGGTGLAPNASIIPVDFMDGDGGDEFNAISGIEYGIARGARIINNSWISPCSQLLKEKYLEWDKDGVLLINAAGNHSLNLLDYPEYSSNYIGPAFLAVGSVDHFYSKAGFSNFGPSVLLYAPGTNIWTAQSFAEYPLRLVQVSGTSYSAAITSGAAALIWSKNPHWTNHMVKDHLVVNSKKITPSSIQILNIK